MSQAQNILEQPAENLFQDVHPLIDQLGSSDGLLLASAVNTSLPLNHINNFPDLKKFLQDYHAQLLAPLELPLICQAYLHASKNQFSELIVLDQNLIRETRLDFFAAASQRIGRIQLRRLRPMRDQKGLLRYISAVDAGHAYAWHTLVHGITLASFFLPLRQGLLHYSEQVIAGFVRAASRRFLFPETDGQQLIEETCSTIPKSIEQALLAKSFYFLPDRILEAK